MTEKLTITCMEDEGDRVLLYGKSSNYHVIASPEEAEGLRAGMEIEYEPMGVNFGWFVSRVR
jgi:hypothetical protein